MSKNETSTVSLPIRVVIVDDHSAIRRGVASLFQEQPDQFTIVGNTGNGQEALKLCLELTPPPDVLIVDIDLGQSGLDGLEICRLLKKVYKRDLKVIIFTMHDLAATIFKEVGASGWLRKSDAVETLVDLVLELHTNPASNPLPSPTPTANAALLIFSDREIQVLKLIAAGKKDSEIAESLSISTGTVGTHSYRIKDKLGLRNRAEIVRWVIENRVFD